MPWGQSYFVTGVVETNLTFDEGCLSIHQSSFLRAAAHRQSRNQSQSRFPRRSLRRDLRQ